MTMHQATALAHPNIAFIKYWGNRDDNLRIPLNGSISMNLGDLFTQTTVEVIDQLEKDELTINNHIPEEAAISRVRHFMNIIRSWAGDSRCAVITSVNNFPAGAGIASSASAFAALSLAASKAYRLKIDMNDLSRLARRGSGSACRSIPGGFVEWLAGSGDHDSFAVSIAPPGYWNLIDIIAVVEELPKKIGSSEGHRVASSSIFQDCRLADAERRIDICRQSILAKDFEGLATISELDSNLMHAVMMTSIPPLFYWSPTTLQIMKLVQEMRTSGIPVFYTIDAGPNVHIIAEKDAAQPVQKYLTGVPGIVRLLISSAGGSARLV